ncbi:MAG: glutamate--tRNA ligase [Planctomycetota bacterium]
MSDRPVRTRIAPSPTGDPHVGTGYMGLVNMVHARQHGGQFILRIDDTDRGRYRADSEQQIFDSLRWLGIEWDEGPDKGGPHGPYRQSERTPIYQQVAKELVDRGAAYPCFMTAEELDEVRKQQLARKETPRYPGTWRDADPAEVKARLAAGEPHVIRLKMPAEGSVAFQDLLRGEIELKQDNFQDQVLLKQDGYPTYHLASCVDDHMMQITHIIRAEEWISSAAIHVQIFKGLGWPMPVLCHMPLLRNADKSKISKRKNPTSLLHYRDAGFLPEAMLNFLGLMGWGGPKEPDGSNREFFSVDDMVEHFRLDQVRVGGPVFDQDKLRHINANHLRALTPASFVEAFERFALSRERLVALAPLVQPRVETLGEVAERIDFFLGDVNHWTPETRKHKDEKLRTLVEGLVPKGREPQDVWFALRVARETLELLESFDPALLETTCRGLASDESGWKARDLFMTLRVAIAGKQETPPLFETMQVLGKPRVLARIDQAMRAIGEPSKKAIAKWEKERKAREQPKADD